VHFFSAQLLFIILVADGPGRRRNDYDESVVVFRARDLDHAVERARVLGRKQETTYKNRRGKSVRWAFVEILRIRDLGRTLDGQEVASRLHQRTSKRRISPGRVFHPERLNVLDIIW